MKADTEIRTMSLYPMGGAPRVASHPRAGSMAWSGSSCSLRRSQPPPLCSPPIPSPPPRCWTSGLQTVRDQFLLLLGPPGPGALLQSAQETTMGPLEGSYCGPHSRVHPLLQTVSLPASSSPLPPWCFLGSTPKYISCIEALSQGLHLGKPKPKQVVSGGTLGSRHTGRESTLTLLPSQTAHSQDAVTVRVLQRNTTSKTSIKRSTISNGLI